MKTRHLMILVLFLTSRETFSTQIDLCQADQNTIAHLQNAGFIQQDSSKLAEYKAQHCSDGSSETNSNVVNKPAQTAPESSSVSYRAGLSIDISDGNYKQNEFEVALGATYQINQELQWELSSSLLQLDEYEENLKSTTREIQLGSQLTYQSSANPRLIGFFDVSAEKNEFTGIDRDVTVIAGAGYALLGDNYHQPCDVLKYSAGLGQKARTFADDTQQSLNILSHKLSMKYSITDDVCLDGKYILQQVLDDDGANKSVASVDVSFKLNTSLSMKASYEQTDDKGALDGFQSKDKRLKLGVDVAF